MIFLDDAAQEVLESTIGQVQWHQAEAQRLGQAAFNVACSLSGIEEAERSSYHLTQVDGKLALVAQEVPEPILEKEVKKK